jgi:tetratricopeptide (TPR) repeat protein
MLPTVREYAAERLGDKAETVRQHHAEHFLNVLGRADDQIRGKEQMAGIYRTTADLENIRAGMDTAVRNVDHPTVVTYSQAFHTYFLIKGLFAEMLRRGHQGLTSAEVLEDDELIAGCRNNLGIAYRNLPTGDRGKNLKNAIESYEGALRVYTEDGFPVDWAMTRNNLGAAYWNLPTGDRGENFRNAIECFEATLRVYTEDGFPGDWAMTLNNLGTAYADLPAGDRGENVKKAIEYFEAALRVHTEDGFPVDWAGTRNNLGVAYANLPAGDRGENLKKAIESYEAALRVYTEDEFPV